MTRGEKKIFNKAPTNDETCLRALYERLADLTPSNTKTDSKDTTIVAQAVRTINGYEKESAVWSRLTGFDPDLALSVNQAANRIRGQSFTQTSPRPRNRPATPAGARRHPGGQRRLAHPTALKKGGRARINTRLKVQ